VEKITNMGYECESRKWKVFLMGQKKIFAKRMSGLRTADEGKINCFG